MLGVLRQQDAEPAPPDAVSPGTGGPLGTGGPMAPAARPLAVRFAGHGA
jgi:hypothetical protein